MLRLVSFSGNTAAVQESIGIVLGVLFRQTAGQRNDHVAIILIVAERIDGFAGHRGQGGLYAASFGAAGPAALLRLFRHDP